jgi:hypothetical protein
MALEEVQAKGIEPSTAKPEITEAQTVFFGDRR